MHTKVQVESECVMSSSPSPKAKCKRFLRRRLDGDGAVTILVEESLRLETIGVREIVWIVTHGPENAVGIHAVVYEDVLTRDSVRQWSL